MADVRCPMCGKTNPAEREVCLFCQARLKPLGGETSGGSSDVPDWLRSIQDGTTAGAPSTPQPSAVPDWLSGLRDQTLGDGILSKDQGEIAPAGLHKGHAKMSGDFMLSPDDLEQDHPPGQKEDDYSDADSDWLSRIGGGEERPASQPFENSDLPDWLRSEAMPGEAVASGSKAEAELPDWLRGSTSTGDIAAPGSETEMDLPDWLRSEATTNAPAAPASDADAGIPDWLSGSGQAADMDWLRSEAVPGEVAAPGGETKMDLPDWLRSDAVPGVPAAPAGEAEAGLPDWLSAPDKKVSEDWLHDEAAPGVAAAPVGKTEPELPDWLHSEAAPGVPAPSVSKTGTGLSDWLRRETDTSAQAATGGEAETGLPEWLTGNVQEGGLDWLHGPATPGAPAAAGSHAEMEFPDWLASSGEADNFDWLRDAGTPGPGTVPGGEAEMELPDWLRSDTAPGAPAAKDDLGPLKLLPGRGDESNLDWLGSAATPGDAAAPGDKVDAGLPDWLSEGKEESDLDWLRTEASPRLEAEPGEAAEAGLPDWLAGIEGNLPDWLQSAETAGAPARADSYFPGSGKGSDQGDESSKFPLSLGPGLLAADHADGDLSWLDNLEAYSVPAPQSTDALSSDSMSGSALADVEQVRDSALPGWLSQVTARDEASDEERRPVEGEGELKPVDLPVWLQAMRPVGVVGAPGGPAYDAAGPIEGAGPLSGLRNVLPAEPEVTQTERPPVYSVKLQVSEAQQVHADLLKGLIDAEGQSHAVPGRPIITSQHVLRIVMAALIILPVFVSLVTRFPKLSVPGVMPEVDAANRLIGGLLQGTPVLLAIDYEPGWSGEMDILTGAVISQLLTRQSFLTLVSTVSTGPVQAEHLLLQLRSSKGVTLQADQQYVNLGFIPGGAAGLLSFATSPRTTIGGDAWQVGTLQNVNSLANFSAVIVATANVDTARAWIEQVGPGLGSAPLIMIVSAQVEPIVQPYYNANPAQIQGLISGLAGGAHYEWVTAQSGAASAYWSPFGVGMVIAGLLIVMGGIFNLMSTRVLRRKENAENQSAAGSEAKQ